MRFKSSMLIKGETYCKVSVKDQGSHKLIDSDQIKDLL